MVVALRMSLLCAISGRLPCAANTGHLPVGDMPGRLSWRYDLVEAQKRIAQQQDCCVVIPRSACEMQRDGGAILHPAHACKVVVVDLHRMMTSQGQRHGGTALPPVELITVATCTAWTPTLPAQLHLASRRWFQGVTWTKNARCGVPGPTGWATCGGTLY